MLTPLRLPTSIPTVAVYLRPEDLRGPGQDRRTMGWLTWVRHLNRLVTRGAVVLSGLEPIRHPDFYDLLNGLRPDLPIEIETRLSFDTDVWLDRVVPERFDPARLEPTFRVRFDPRTMNVAETIERALLLQGAGFQLGLQAVLVPTHKAEALAAAEMGRRAGLDFRTVPFFGRLGSRLFGQYRYRSACLGSSRRVPGLQRVFCRPRQLFLSPAGEFFGCRHDLLVGEPVLGRLTREQPRMAIGFRPCTSFGTCHPADVAVTVDRRGRLAQTTVDILPQRRRRAAS